MIERVGGLLGWWGRVCNVKNTQTECNDNCTFFSRDGRKVIMTCLPIIPGEHSVHNQVVVVNTVPGTCLACKHRGVHCFLCPAGC